jgi:hypothetical protein
MRTTRLIGLLAVLGALALPALASADTVVFHRFEAIATADWRLTEDCGGGVTAPLRVFVQGIYENEVEDGVQNADDHSIRFGIQGGCDNVFISRTSNTATLTWSPSLQTAHLVGTATTSTGRVLTADITWTGTGPLEVDQNMVNFPGRVAHFVGRERAVDATGTVTLDGEALVNGQTSTFDRLETLEDKIIEKPNQQDEEF